MQSRKQLKNGMNRHAGDGPTGRDRLLGADRATLAFRQA
jgi:hypothetical protein